MLTEGDAGFATPSPLAAKGPATRARLDSGVSGLESVDSVGVDSDGVPTAVASSGVSESVSPGASTAFGSAASEATEAGGVDALFGSWPSVGAWSPLLICFVEKWRRIKTGQFGGGVPSGKPLCTLPLKSWRVHASVVLHFSNETHVFTRVTFFQMKQYFSVGTNRLIALPSCGGPVVGLPAQRNGILPAALLVGAVASAECSLAMEVLGR